MPLKNNLILIWHCHSNKLSRAIVQYFQNNLTKFTVHIVETAITDIDVNNANKDRIILSAEDRSMSIFIDDATAICSYQSKKRIQYNNASYDIINTVLGRHVAYNLSDPDLLKSLYNYALTVFKY